MIDWVRLWHDMPTDPKWRVIAKRSGRSISDVIAVFTFVMVNASGNAVKRGETHNLFHDDIAAALDIEKEAVDAIILAMTGKVIDSKGALTGWEKRQPKREDSKSTERVREFRKRNETQRNAVKRPDTDTDTEEESKEEAIASLSSGDDVGAITTEAFSLYNEAAKRASWPQCETISKERKTRMRARLKDGGLERWKQGLARAAVSDHCCGVNDRGWRVDVDFLLQKSSFIRLMEGRYDNREQAANGNGLTEKFRRAAQIIDNERGGDEGGSQDRQLVPLHGKDFG